MIEEFDGSPYPIRQKPPETTYYNWTDKATGEVHRVPVGIDPGWDYHPGKTVFGQPPARL